MKDKEGNSTICPACPKPFGENSEFMLGQLKVTYLLSVNLFMIMPFCWMIFSLSSCSLTSTNLVQNQRMNDKFICPVCDKEITLVSEAFSYKYNSKEKKYLFGTYECKEVFKRNPEKFIDNDTAEILTK